MESQIIEIRACLGGLKKRLEENPKDENALRQLELMRKSNPIVVIIECLGGIEERLRENPKDDNTLRQLESMRQLYQSRLYRQMNPIPPPFEYMFN